jgi:antitoxin component YwqK of YwqJK toxin-antitoxin module
MQTYLYNTGEICKKHYYVDGVIMTGTYYEHYRDGNIRAIYSFINGKMEGQYVEFYPNWNVKAECKFKNGKPIGKFYTYDEERNVLTMSDYG